MATFEKFEDIRAWQQARDLTNAIYALTQEGAFSKDYGLRNQIRQASISILSNIAEGFERSGSGEFHHFLSMAKGSAGEVRAQLYVALDQGYIGQENFQALTDLAIETGQLIGGLMSYLRKKR